MKFSLCNPDSMVMMGSREKIFKSTEFGWQMQLRYYWDDALEDCIVRQTNAKFIYAYEYLGAYMAYHSLACQNDQILKTIIGLWI
jgi:hypothetical protein